MELISIGYKYFIIKLNNFLSNKLKTISFEFIYEMSFAGLNEIIFTDNELNASGSLTGYYEFTYNGLVRDTFEFSFSKKILLNNIGKSVKIDAMTYYTDNNSNYLLYSQPQKTQFTIFVPSPKEDEFLNNCFILYRFKFTFYCLKLKKKLRDWLWIKIRLPKITNKYNPKNLMKLLEIFDGDDMNVDIVLDAW
jgi:hypothetical protein